MAKKDNVKLGMAGPEVEEVTQALASPFDPQEVRFKPGVVNGNRALALAYVDARVIQDRLDEVLGVLGWQDEYECLPDGSVVCRLRVRLGSEWITKMDVGGQSEQPDEGDRRKAAFSDALKRAAVKFGIGRYLYRLPPLWVDYDPQRRRFVRPPMLPPEAMPRRVVQASQEKEPASAPAATEEKKPAKGAEKRNGKKVLNQEPGSAPTAEHNGSTNGHTGPRRAAGLPANGEELQRRLYDYDAHLARQGVSVPGELVKHVVQAGLKAGYQADLATWTQEGIRLAVEQTKVFENEKRKDHMNRREVA